jgi:cytochrome oxidase Cu insertion factor (SCO1/SenC/PrrC family)
MSNRFRTILLAAVAVLVGAGIGLGIALGTRSSPHPGRKAQTGRAVGELSRARVQAQATWPVGARRAPDFRLRDQRRRLFSLRSQRGHVVFLTFLNSHCKEACPLEGRQLGEIQRTFPRTRRPPLVVVSINPAGDTVASIDAAAHRWAFALPWYWLGGRHAQLARIWRAYSIDVRPRQRDIAHSTALYVLDGAGSERAGYLFPFSSRGVAAAVRALEVDLTPTRTVWRSQHDGTR